MPDITVLVDLIPRSSIEKKLPMNPLKAATELFIKLILLCLRGLID